MKRHVSFSPSAPVCCKKIEFDLEDNVVKNLKFTGGCPGNLQAIGKLVEGMPATEAIAKLSGIRCGGKPTSCTDQFAQSLRSAIAAE